MRGVEEMLAYDRDSEPSSAAGLRGAVVASVSVSVFRVVVFVLILVLRGRGRGGEEGGEGEIVEVVSEEIQDGLRLGSGRGLLLRLLLWLGGAEEGEERRGVVEGGERAGGGGRGGSGRVAGVVLVAAG